MEASRLHCLNRQPQECLDPLHPTAAKQTKSRCGEKGDIREEIRLHSKVQKTNGGGFRLIVLHSSAHHSAGASWFAPVGMLK